MEKSHKVKSTIGTSVSLYTYVSSSEFLANQIKCIVSDAVEMLNASEFSIDNEANHDLAENSHFQSMPKLLHDFRQFTSSLMILDNHVLLLNQCDDVTTKTSMTIAQFQNCYFS